MMKTFQFVRALFFAMSCMIASIGWSDDLKEIKDRGELRHLGIKYANFVTGAGDGFDVEMVQGFAKYLGVNYRLVLTDFANVMKDLLGKNVVRSNNEIFRKSSPELRKAFDEYMEKIKADGTYDSLAQKYYPTVKRYFPEFFTG